VLAVIDALKLNRPVIAGHSIAGEELSSIGSRHPERVAGLIYLEAGYPYAYYDHARGDFAIDLGELRRKLEEMEFGRLPQDPRPLVQEVLENTLPAFERDLRELQKSMVATPPPASAGAPPRPAFAPAAIIEGQRKYSDVRAPILAIYALPHAPPAAIRNNPEAVAKADAVMKPAPAHKRRRSKRAYPPRAWFDWRMRVTTSFYPTNRTCCAR